MTSDPVRAPADDARAEGRVVVAGVRHQFEPGWVVALVKRRSLKTDGGFVQFPPHAGQPQRNKPDPARCRVCARPEHAACHYQDED